MTFNLASLEKPNNEISLKCQTVFPIFHILSIKISLKKTFKYISYGNSSILVNFYSESRRGNVED